MGSLLKLIVEFGMAFLAGAARSTGDAVTRVHDGLASGAESLMVGISEFLFMEPLRCMEAGCSPDLVASAIMVGIVVALVLLLFRRFRWLPAFGYGAVSVLGVIAVGFLGGA